MFEGALRKDLEVAEFVAGWTEFEDFVAVLAEFYAKIEV